MTKHTPGPWKWEVIKGEQKVTEHTLHGPDVLCRYWYDEPPSADARLIAVAPELLEAAKAAENLLLIHSDGRSRDVGLQLEAAIAKAENPEPRRNLCSDTL